MHGAKQKATSHDAALRDALLCPKKGGVCYGHTQFSTVGTPATEEEKEREENPMFPPSDIKMCDDGMLHDASHNATYSNITRSILDGSF
jgi:hypothetical protein